MSVNSGRSKFIFAFLLAAVAIGAMFVMSRAANAAVVKPETAVVAQPADSSRGLVGRPGFAGIAGRPGFAGFAGRPNVGVVRPVVQPVVGPLFRPIINPVVIDSDEEVLFFGFE